MYFDAQGPGEIFLMLHKIICKLEPEKYVEKKSFSLRLSCGNDDLLLGRLHSTKSPSFKNGQYQSLEGAVSRKFIKVQ